MAEGKGFEPLVRCRITGFQDQLLKPLGHPSESASFKVASVFYQIIKQLSIHQVGFFVYIINKSFKKTVKQRR